MIFFIPCTHLHLLDLIFQVHISETDVYGDSIQNSSKHTCDNPDKMMPFKSSVNSDKIFDSIMDYKKNLAKVEFENRVSRCHYS